METLAIVAYLQPVTKSEIEALRGVNVDWSSSTLVDRGFVAEAGRKDVVGRPMVYKTTPLFLESFGLRSLAEFRRSMRFRGSLLPLPLAERVAADEKGSGFHQKSITDNHAPFGSVWTPTRRPSP